MSTQINCHPIPPNLLLTQDCFCLSCAHKAATAVKQTQSNRTFFDPSVYDQNKTYKNAGYSKLRQFPNATANAIDV